jgi:multiple sugar transport system substrate-binding protein
VLAEGENIYVTATNAKTDDTKKVLDFLVSAEGQQVGMTGGKQPIVRLPVNSGVDAAKVYGDERWAVVQDALNTSSKALPSAINVIPIKQDAAEALNKIMSDCAADNITSGLDQLNATINDELSAQNAKQ